MISRIFPRTSAVDTLSHKEAQGAQEAAGQKREDKRDGGGGGGGPREGRQGQWRERSG